MYDIRDLLSEAVAHNAKIIEKLELERLTFFHVDGLSAQWVKSNEVGDVRFLAQSGHKPCCAANVRF